MNIQVFRIPPTTMEKRLHELMIVLQADLESLFEKVRAQSFDLLNNPHLETAAFIYVVEHVISKHYSAHNDKELLDCILKLIKLDNQ